MSHPEMQLIPIGVVQEFVTVRKVPSFAKGLSSYAADSKCGKHTCIAIGSSTAEVYAVLQKSKLVRKLAGL